MSSLPPDPGACRQDVSTDVQAEATSFAKARDIVQLILDSKIGWADIVHLHTTAPVSPRIALSELRTPEERSLAGQLESFLFDRFADEQDFKEASHTLVTRLLDFPIHHFLLMKVGELEPKE